jgi:hypothetical protein
MADVEVGLGELPQVIEMSHFGRLRGMLLDLWNLYQVGLVSDFSCVMGGVMSWIRLKYKGYQ